MAISYLDAASSPELEVASSRRTTRGKSVGVADVSVGNLFKTPVSDGPALDVSGKSCVYGSILLHKFPSILSN